MWADCCSAREGARDHSTGAAGWRRRNRGIGRVRPDRRATSRFVRRRAHGRIRRREPRSHPVTWTRRDDATGKFEVGSIGGSVKASVGASLEYIRGLGVDNIQAHRQPLLQKLRDEMPRLGFTPVTPAESTGPIITFAMKDGREVQRRRDAARVNARVSDHWIRLAPSVYNDMHHVDRLLEALS